MELTMSGRGRAAVLATLVATACAIGVVAIASKAEARSCPQAAALLKTGFSGTGSMSYVSGTVSKAVDMDGDEVETISLNHRASGLKIALAKPESGSGGAQAFGQPTSGAVAVSDSFNDPGDPGDPGGDLQTPPSSSRQTYSGPNKPTQQDSVSLSVDSSSCTYTLSFGFDVPTTTSANGALAPNQPGEGDQVVSPSEPIPSGLKLSGNATIPPVFGGDCLRDCYDLSGDPDWGGDLDLAAGSPKSEPGTAMMSWQLSPTGPAPGECVVPRVRGLTERHAASELKGAGCRLGRITHKRSKSERDGRVIASSPKAGSKRPAGAKVALVVSSG